MKKSRTGKKGKRYLEPEESMQDLEAAIQAKAIIPKAANNSEKRPEQVGALVGADKDRSGGPTLLHHNFGEGDFIYLDILRSDHRLSHFS